MSTWWKERWFVVVALVLNAIQLVVTLQSRPTALQVAVPAVVFCGLLMLALRKKRPFEYPRGADLPSPDAAARLKALIASLLFLAAAIACFIGSSRSQGGEAIFLAVLGLLSLYLATFGLWGTWKLYWSSWTE